MLLIITLLRFGQPLKAWAYHEEEKEGAWGYRAQEHYLWQAMAADGNEDESELKAGIHEETGQNQGQDQDDDNTLELAGSEHGSSDHEPSSETEEEQPEREEDVLRKEAATWLQRTIRGHAARRRSLLTPVWAMYPSRVQAMSWGYQRFFEAQDVEDVKRNYSFEEQLGVLDAVLENGLGALPHLFKKELNRPMAHRRSRASYLRSLVEFCLDMGGAYSRWGRGGEAEFMLQSAETLCTLPPCEDSNATRSLDPCNFKGKTSYLVSS